MYTYFFFCSNSISERNGASLYSERAHLGHDDLDGTSLKSRKSRQLHVSAICPPLSHHGNIVFKRSFRIHKPFKALWMGFHVVAYLRVVPISIHAHLSCDKSAHLLSQCPMSIIISQRLITQCAKHAVAIANRLASVESH